MLKKMMLFCLIISFQSCKSQNKEPKKTKISNKTKMEIRHEYNELITRDFEKFDIERFNKNKNATGDYIYILNDGTKISEFGYPERGYFSESILKTSHFIISKGFYPNLNVKSKGIRFKNGCAIGVWYDYDESGKLIKETDYDKPYKIRVEDIIEFFKKNKANFNAYIYVNRCYDEKSRKGTWDLNYRGKYKEIDGIYLVTIDDLSGEIEEVIKITGKHGEKQIIFKK